MIEEELERKLHKITDKKLHEFLDSLTPEEQMLVIMIPPELFAKIWHGAATQVLAILREMDRDD